MGASPRETETQRALQDAERANAAQLAARKDAADRAARAAADALRLAHDRVEAAAKLRQAEAATAEIATQIDALAQRRRDAEQRVADRAKALQPLLPLIERLSLYPAETLLAVPAPPDEALRGVLVLQSLSRQIEIEAEALRHDQADLEAAVAALQLEAPHMAEAEAAQRRQADALDQQVEAAHQDQAAAEAQANEAANQAALAASRRDSLRAALAAIDAQRRADEAKAKEDAARAERQKRPVEAEAAREREAVAARPTGAGDNRRRRRASRPVTGAGDRRGGEGLGRADRRRAIERDCPIMRRRVPTSYRLAAGAWCSPPVSGATGCC